MSESPPNHGDPIAPHTASTSVPQRHLQFGFFGLFAMVTVVAMVAGALHGAGGGVAFSVAICLLGVWLMVVAYERGATAYLGGIIVAFGAIGLFFTLLAWSETVLRQSPN